MSDGIAPNALLAAGPDGPTALLDAIGRERLTDLSPTWLAVLEASLHSDDLAEVERLAQAAASSPTADLADDDRYARAFAAVAAGGLVLVAPRGLRVLPDGLFSDEGHVTLTRLSEERGGVLPWLLGVPPATPAQVTSTAVATAVAELQVLGLLVPPVGEIDWGDLRRVRPVCEVFGAGRGTPIDRHYLSEFVASIRPLITGDVLDVGGHRSDRVHFRLREVASFRVADLQAREHVDVVGDAHDPALVPAESVDSVLLFNVLEHCRDPRLVAQNVHGWLRPGGRCFAMVPNAQRLHHAAEDHWRFSASGLQLVFGDFASTEPHTYGSFTTVLASYAGIAAEELTSDELDAHQLDHPVATCLVATK